MGELGHDELIEMAERHLRGTRGCSIVLTERGGGVVTEEDVSEEIVDAIGWGRDGSILIECKTGIEDFYHDRKKPGRREESSGRGMGRERWYLTPKGLLGKSNKLPPRWGLLEVRGSRVYRAREAENQPEWNRTAETRMLTNALRDWHQVVVENYGEPVRTWEDKWRLVRAAERGRRAEETERRLRAFSRVASRLRSCVSFVNIGGLDMVQILDGEVFNNTVSRLLELEKEERDGAAKSQFSRP